MNALTVKLSTVAMLLGAAVILALTSCTSTDAFKTLYALDGTYTGAATAEATYCKSSIADANVCAQMKDYDNKAYAALQRLTVAAQQPGATIDGVALAGAETAVTAFASYVTSHQVKS